MKKVDGLRECSRQCMTKKKECKETECRLWQDYPDEEGTMGIMGKYPLMEQQAIGSTLNN